jgi:L-aspartate oxidase
MKRSPRVLILGSGIAGLTAALNLSRQANVTLVAKSDASEGATRYAQGGIAAVWDRNDRFEDHIQDTLIAGAGLCDPKIVDLCVREGPSRVRELIQWGVSFTKKESLLTDPAEEFDLHQEERFLLFRFVHLFQKCSGRVEGS